MFQAQEQLSRLPRPWRLQKPAKPLWHQEQSHARAPCSLDLICFNFVLIWVVFSLGCSSFFFTAASAKAIQEIPKKSGHAAALPLLPGGTGQELNSH